MMDRLLSLLPAREELIRTTAFAFTRFANVCMSILILLLVFDWMRQNGKMHSPSWFALVSLIVLLSVPEIFYFGLVYSPSLVAMCLVLSAHLVLRRAYRGSAIPESRGWIAFLLSMILFGLGVSFRWNVLAYGLVIATDLLLVQSAAKPMKRLLHTALWGLFALTSSYLMILLSGYELADILAQFRTVQYVVNQAGSLGPGAAAGYREILLRTALALSPLLSPIFVLGVFAGLLKMITNKNKLGFLALAGFLGVMPWLQSGVPKFIITFLPALILLFVTGLEALGDLVPHKRLGILGFAFTAFLLFPWVVGIQVQREGLAWGPGFEVQPFDRAEVSGTHISLALSAGAAFPTPEGERPLYGHAYVLLGGEWKRFMVTRELDRQNAIEEVQKLGVPLVITSWSPDFFLDALYARGFQTSDPRDRTVGDGYFIERRFFDQQGNTVTVLFHEIAGGDITEVISHLKQNAGSNQYVIFGYSQNMRALYRNYPDALEALGPYFAIFNLED